MDKFEDKVKARIAELTKTRDEFVQQANQQIAAMNGGIAELNQLLKPEAEAPEEQAPEAE